jgi:hypothetical protein
MTSSASGNRPTIQLSGSEMVHGRPIRTYGRGRSCEVEDCDTRLSLYNPGPVCALHKLGY